MSQKKITFDISVSSVLRVAFALLLLWFVFVIRDILAIGFIAIIFAATFSPLVDRLSEQGIPRTLTIIFLYLAVIFGLGGFLFYVLPPVIVQLKGLANVIPTQLQGLQDFFQNIQAINVGDFAFEGSGISDIIDFFSNVLSNTLSTTIGVFNALAAIATIFVLSLYLLLEEDGIKKFFVSLLPVKQKDQIVKTATRIGKKLGGWLRAQFILGLAIGILTYIGLSLLNVPYALTLALIAGIFELVPIIGPILAAIPAIIVAFVTTSPTMALVVMALYIALQELENKLLVPQVMKQAVGLNPVTIIIVLLIGAKLMGIIGILLAVPVTAAIYVILEDWLIFDHSDSKSPS